VFCKAVNTFILGGTYTVPLFSCWTYSSLPYYGKPNPDVTNKIHPICRASRVSLSLQDSLRRPSSVGMGSIRSLMASPKPPGSTRGSIQLNSSPKSVLAKAVTDYRRDSRDAELLKKLGRLATPTASSREIPPLLNRSRTASRASLGMWALQITVIQWCLDHKFVQNPVKRNVAKTAHYFLKCSIQYHQIYNPYAVQKCVTCLYLPATVKLVLKLIKIFGLKSIYNMEWL